MASTFSSSYVRVVKSDSPGDGKSLYIHRLGEKLAKSFGIKVPIMRIPIHGPDVPNDIILNELRGLSNDTRIIHFDIASSVGFKIFMMFIEYLIDVR